MSPNDMLSLKEASMYLSMDEAKGGSVRGNLGGCWFTDQWRATDNLPPSLRV